jgi:hypothetical protein
LHVVTRDAHSHNTVSDEWLAVDAPCMRALQAPDPKLCQLECKECRGTMRNENVAHAEVFLISPPEAKCHQLIYRHIYKYP